MSDNRLGQLLWERVNRLHRQDSERAILASEDYIRWQQKWRRPWYQTDSEENGWPARWIVRRCRP